MRNRRYCLITPCRNEALFAERTLESVTGQSVPPARWVIVDCGSTDGTAEILAEYARKYEYIRVVRRAMRAKEPTRIDAIEAFDAGYATIDPLEFEYVCKLDLDVELPRRYFELLIERMEADPRLGTCSGKPYFIAESGEPVSEMCGDENSVGMAKFYRRKCLEEIGGFVHEEMWDGIDGHLCRMRGWIAASWDEEPLRFVHLRPMGISDNSWWTGRIRHGRGQYVMGTDPVYMVASAFYRMSRPPRGAGGVAMLWGYFASLVRRTPRYENAAFRRFLRQYQRACLMHGKQLATELLNRRQSLLWAARNEHIVDPIVEAEAAPAGRMSAAF